MEDQGKDMGDGQEGATVAGRENMQQALAENACAQNALTELLM